MAEPHTATMRAARTPLAVRGRGTSVTVVMRRSPRSLT